MQDISLTDSTSNLPPLVIIAGPTASGKSAASVALAKRFHGAVISADSMQVYRGMDIGSAKITKEEADGIPHYLIDLISPSDPWNVVRFHEEAKKAELQIRAQGKIPFLVGGTGFYIQSLLYDIDFTQTREDTSYRDRLASYAKEYGNEALHRQLAKVDPEAAEQIHPNNIKRVIRALEYREQSGEKISLHNKEQAMRPAAYRSVFFVLTMDRARLYERIDRRVDQMMEDGLLDEVISLKKAGLSVTDVSMQGLGYKQLLQYLDGMCTLEEAVAQIKIQTRHFAKRQLTWFKREKDIIWIDREQYENTDRMIDDMEAIIRGRLEK